MRPGSAHADVERLRLRVAGWPQLIRDIGAASLTLWAVFLGELLATVLPFRTEVLLALPGAVAAFWIFGTGSTLFGLLVAAVVVQVMAAERSATLFGFSYYEMAGPALAAFALIVLCTSLRLWARQREHRTALLMDACAGDALGQIAAANERLARAQADAAAARAELARACIELSRRPEPAPASAKPLVPDWRDAFEEARRQEGGV